MGSFCWAPFITNNSRVFFIAFFFPLRPRQVHRLPLGFSSSLLVPSTHSRGPILVLLPNPPSAPDSPPEHPVCVKRGCHLVPQVLLTSARTRPRQLLVQVGVHAEPRPFCSPRSVLRKSTSTGVCRSRIARVLFVLESGGTVEHAADRKSVRNLPQKSPNDGRMAAPYKDPKMWPLALVRT